MYTGGGGICSKCLPLPPTPNILISKIVLLNIIYAKESRGEELSGEAEKRRDLERRAKEWREAKSGEKDTGAEERRRRRRTDSEE